MNNQENQNGRFHWVHESWAWLKNKFNLFKASDAPVDDTPNGEKIAEPSDQIEALTRHFEFEPNVFPEMSDDLRKQIKGIMNGSWGLGYTDGLIGQRQMTSEFFRAQAEQVRDQYLYFLKGKAIPAATKAEKLKERFEKASEVLEQAQDYRNDATTRRQLYPRQFSRSLAVIYIAIAALLLLADIPLALMITQLIFDLAPPDTEHDITYLLFRPEDDPCGGLPAHFWRVITGNWQVTIMTVGVALCAIYFKIFYDDSMGYSVDKSIRQFRLLSLNNRFKKQARKKQKERKKVSATCTMYG
ncbi:MAG: hypothetical protein KDD14_14090 [Saprospiraceae bacterium]|nr:hypothetical protein [Saprospiraceae bacterium]